MTFATFLTDVLTLFLFVVWFWLLIIVFSTYSEGTTYLAGVKLCGL